MSEGRPAHLALWPDFVLRRPLLVVLLAALLTLASLVYLRNHLEINTNTTDMIAADVPFRQHAIAFKAAFPQFQNAIVLVIDGPSPEASEAAAKALADRLAGDTELFSAVSYQGGDPFFERNGLLYLQTEALGDLADRLAEAQPLLAVLRAAPNLAGLADFVELILTRGEDPKTAALELEAVFGAFADAVQAANAGLPGEVSWRRLLAGEGRLSRTRQIVLAEPRFDYQSLAPAGRAIARVREVAADLGLDSEHGLALRLTGNAAINHEELQSVQEGAELASLLAFAGVTLLLIWGLRSFRLIAATLLTLVAGLIVTAGLAALLVGHFNLISVTFAVLFVGLGIDFGIHLALRYQEEHAPGSDHASALRRALFGVLAGLSLSALAAGLGFIAFLPTDYLGLAELGVISAGGMLVAWLMSLTLLPALLTLLPAAGRSLGSGGPVLAPWIERRAKPILLLALLLSLAALPTLPLVEFDFNPLNLKDPASESVSTYQDLRQDPDLGVDAIDLLAPDPAAAEAMAAKLEALAEVGEVVTLQSFLPKEQDAKLQIIDDMAFLLGSLAPAPAGVDDDARKAAFDRLSRVLDGASLPEGSGLDRFRETLEVFAAHEGDPGALADLDRRLTGELPPLLEHLDQALAAGPVTLEDLPPAIRDRWIGADGQVRLMVKPAAPMDDNRDLEHFADAVLAVAPAATGAPVVVTEAARAVIGAFAEASLIAFGLITLLLIIVLRRPADVVLVFLPLAVAVLWTAASAVILGLALNFANVIVLPLLLGLGVSGAIHVVVRRRQAGAAAAGGLASTPRAILFSALTTIASFGSLAVSSHLGMASMGLLLTIAILWSLVATLILLPALLTLKPATTLPS